MRPVEIRGFTSEDADGAAALYIQSAEHHAQLDPDFYRVPPLEVVAAHYRELAKTSATEPRNCFVAESDATVVGMVEVRISDPPSTYSMLRPRRIAAVDIVVDSGNRRQLLSYNTLRRMTDWRSYPRDS